jgi:hypothetical protein
MPRLKCLIWSGLGQAFVELGAGRRPKRAWSAAISFLMTVTGLPSRRAKSIARRTMSVTSMALAM